MVGGSYEDLGLDAKQTINMGTMLPLKIHKRGEGEVKPGRHGLIPKVGIEERMMEFLNRLAGGNK